MFHFGLQQLVALLQCLLGLAGLSLGGIDYSDRIADGQHVLLTSRAHAQDGVARFECKASDSGWCHYTLYPQACTSGRACRLPPMQRFAVARGDSRQLSGLREFRLCVGIDDAALGPDCQPTGKAP